jgi:hypothetical protein
MNVVILQPSYIPWRGFFHQIQKADVFVFYDDVQYDKNGWRNRNRVKTPAGSRWLTIPVNTDGVVSQHIPINEVKINWIKPWNSSHWDILKQFYKTAPYYKDYVSLLEPFYIRHDERLASFTIDLTITISRSLGIKTEFVNSSSLKVQGTKTDRLVDILKQVGATHYISGPSAKDYLEEEKLADAGISLEYMVYDYPEYPQLYPPYDPFVSILDLLFMTGAEAPKFIWETTNHLA